MKKGIFVTGTDTGVGKTIVCGGLSAFLRERGVRVGVFKPVETGCLQEEGTMYAQDGEFLRAMAQTNEPLDAVVPYRFREPLAPAVAAEREGARIDPARLMSLYQRIARTHDFVLVEGAGGLMVPLWKNYFMLDLVKDLALPLLVISRATLGTINHTLLTVRCAAAAGIQVVGIVLNHVLPENDRSAASNPQVIARLSGVPVWGVLPYDYEVSPTLSCEARIKEMVCSHLNLQWFEGSVNK